LVRIQAKASASATPVDLANWAVVSPIIDEAAPSPLPAAREKSVGRALTPEKHTERNRATGSAISWSLADVQEKLVEVIRPVSRASMALFVTANEVLFERALAVERARVALFVAAKDEPADSALPVERAKAAPFTAADEDPAETTLPVERANAEVLFPTKERPDESPRPVACAETLMLPVTKEKAAAIAPPVARPTSPVFFPIHEAPRTTSVATERPAPRTCLAT